MEREINIMKTLGCHENVVNFVGYIRKPVSYLPVLEYCANGDLLRYLRNNNDDGNITIAISPRLISICWQIANGMVRPVHLSRASGTFAELPRPQALHT